MLSFLLEEVEVISVGVGEVPGGLNAVVPVFGFDAASLVFERKSTFKFLYGSKPLVDEVDDVDGLGLGGDFTGAGVLAGPEDAGAGVGDGFVTPLLEFLAAKASL
jgi:hypothetical protein